MKRIVLALYAYCAGAAAYADRLDGDYGIVLDGGAGAGAPLKVGTSEFLADEVRDQLLLGLDSSTANQLVITSLGNIGKDHDHADATDPALYVHSSQDPDSGNTEWIGLKTLNAGRSEILSGTSIIDLKILTTTLAMRMSSSGNTSYLNFEIASNRFLTFGGDGDITFATNGVNIADSAAGDGDELGFHRAEVDITATAGATVSSSNFIPAGATVMAISTAVTTALGTGSGTTGYNVGDGTDADAFGAITGTADTTRSSKADWTITSAPVYSSATDIVLTATGGNFDGTGVIKVVIWYITDPTIT